VLRRPRGGLATVDGRRQKLRLGVRPCTDPVAKTEMMPEATPIPDTLANLASLSLQPQLLAAADAMQARLRVLAGLLRQVLRAQEMERRQIAHLLHDELGQVLAAIKIRLLSPTAYDRQPANDTDSETLRIIDDALLLVRRIVPTLRPAVLDHLGLVPALRDLAARTEARAGIPVFVLRLPGADQARLHPELESAAFRIAQEALANAVRHAGAKRIDITMQQDAQMLVLEVSDDGRGFLPLALGSAAGNAAEPGVGILLMRERAALVGGTLEIESMPGQGCRVRLRCPLEPQPTMQ